MLWACRWAIHLHRFSRSRGPSWRMCSGSASGELYKLGIKNPHLVGLTTWNKGKSVVGPALTLQWMPKREDMSANHEYADTELQLHRHVMYHTQPGDIIVVDARGDMAAGIFG